MGGKGDYFWAELDSYSCIMVEFEFFFDEVQEDTALSDALISYSVLVSPIMINLNR